MSGAGDDGAGGFLDDAAQPTNGASARNRTGIVAALAGGAAIAVAVLVLLLAGPGDDEPRAPATPAQGGFALAPSSGPAGTEITVNQKCGSGEPTVVGWVPPGQSEPAIFEFASGPTQRIDVPQLRAATYTVRVTCEGRVLGQAPFTVT